MRNILSVASAPGHSNFFMPGETVPIGGICRSDAHFITIILGKEGEMTRLTSSEFSWLQITEERYSWIIMICSHPLKVYIITYLLNFLWVIWYLAIWRIVSMI